MPTDATGAPGATQISRDLIAGIFLLAIAIAAYFGISGLAIYDQNGIGPGLMPKLVSALIAALGVAILALGTRSGQTRLERFSIRGPLFVLGAVVIFASTIRPLGLAVAGPAAVMFSALGDKDSRPLEVIVFGAILSAACVGLFKYILRLPIPLAPFLLGY